MYSKAAREPFSNPIDTEVIVEFDYEEWFVRHLVDQGPVIRKLSRAA